MIDRRSLLKKFGLLLLPGIVSGLKIPQLKGSEQVIKWEGDLVLDQEMSWDQFCSQILDTLDTKFVDRLNDRLKRSGKLLKMETRFTGESVHWVYYFNDQESFQSWLQETGSKSFKEDFSFRNFKNKTSVVQKSAINFSAPDVVIV